MKWIPVSSVRRLISEISASRCPDGNSDRLDRTVVVALCSAEVLSDKDRVRNRIERLASNQSVGTSRLAGRANHLKRQDVNDFSGQRHHRCLSRMKRYDREINATDLGDQSRLQSPLDKFRSC